MPYEILSEDVLDNNSPPKKNRRRTQNNSRGGGRINIKPFMIHILILLVFFGLIYFFFFSNFFSTEEIEKKETFEIIGHIDEFNKSYSGDIQISASIFDLETNYGNFKQGSKNFNIESFNGTLDFRNKTLILEGTANQILHGENIINLNNVPFKLTINKRFQTSLYFSQYKQELRKGTFIFNNELEYEFNNAEISVENFNMTMVFDGKFTIFGTGDSFALDTDKNNLKIIYEDKPIIDTNETIS